MADLFILEPHSFGLTDEQLKLVGIIAISWNNAESSYEELIWQLADWSEDIGSFVTIHMGSESRAHLLGNLINHGVNEAILKTAATDWMRLFDKVRERRNNIVHALPRYEMGAGYNRYVKRMTKAGKGNIQITAHDFDPTRLEQLAADVRLCEAGHYVLRNGVARYLATRDHLSGPVFEWSEIEREITTRVQTRLTELHRQHPAQGNNLRPPRPSRKSRK